MRGLAESLVRALVDEPDAVRVSERTEDGTVHLKVDVSPEDRGLVIGRRGRTVEALRSVLAVAADKQGLKVNVDVDTSRGRRNGRDDRGHRGR